MEVYLLKLGFLDALAGFVVAVSSVYALFAGYVKLREIEKGFGGLSRIPACLEYVAQKVMSFLNFPKENLSLWLLLTKKLIPGEKVQN